MNKYKSLVEAYRIHPDYETMEKKANRYAQERIQTSSPVEIRLVQTYRTPDMVELQNTLTQKKIDKIIRQFYRNIIVPRRIILLYLYTRRTTMENLCRFLGGADSKRYFDTKAAVWGCTKLKKAMQILDFGYHVTRQGSAIKALDLPLNKTKGSFLKEELDLLSSKGCTKARHIDETTIANHVAAIRQLRETLLNSNSSGEDIYKCLMNYLHEHLILEDKDLMTTLAEHFLDRQDTTRMPRILLH